MYYKLLSKIINYIFQCDHNPKTNFTTISIILNSISLHFTVTNSNAQCKVVRIRRTDFRCRFRNRIRIEDNQAIFVSHTEGARFYHIFSPGFNTDR